MAVANAAVTVGVAATALTVGRVKRTLLVVQNGDAAAIFIGDGTVTVAGAKGGISVAAGATQPFTDCPGVVFAISAAGTAANAVKVFEAF